MKERCSCGATIQGRKSAVVKWRTDHNHPGKEPEKEPEKSGSFASFERAGKRYYESDTLGSYVPIVQARIGFNPNPQHQEEK